MKQLSSVWMAAAKRLWWKLLLILLALLAAETAFMLASIDGGKVLAGDKYTIVSFQSLVEDAHFKFLFFLALTALAACCCLQGCRFSGKNLYTLQRLPLAEWQVVGLWAMVHLACLLILWAVQLAAVFGFWWLYVLEFGSASPGLELLVAFYEGDFLHALLPLADGSQWVVMVAYGVSMACLTASFGFFQRRGRFRIGLLVLLGVYFAMTQGLGYGAFYSVLALGCLGMIAVEIYGEWGALHEE